MFSIERLDVFYGDLQVLWDVSLDVKEGESVALVGSNGAGKSTLIKAIAGLVRQTRGKITFEGTVLNGRAPHEIVEIGISMVPEGRRLFPKMTVLENLEMGAYLKKGRLDRDKSLAWVYEVFPILKERSSQTAGLLSGGEQQMLAIARALMAKNRFLLLDEMSLGLSPLLVRNLFEVIAQINRMGISIFIVEQNVPMTLKVVDRAYVMESGRIVAEGAGRSLLEDERIKEAYLGLGTG